MLRSPTSTDSPAAQRQPVRRYARTLRRNAARVALVVAFLIAWELYVAVGWGEQIIVSRPRLVAERLLTVVADGETWHQVGVTTLGVSIGLAMGLVVGVGAAVALFAVPTVRRAVDPIIMALYSIPRLALLPLFIVWFGFGMSSSVAVIFSQTVVVFLLGTYAALDGVDRNGLVSLRMMGAGWTDLLRFFYWPATIPSLFASFRQALGLGIAGAVVAEWFGRFGGIGQELSTAQARFDMAGVLTWVILAAALACVLDLCASALQARLVDWR